MNEKRITGNHLGGSRRSGDPPAWLDETLPLQERRRLLELAIRAAAGVQQQAARSAEPPADVPDATRLRQAGDGH